MNPSCSCSVEMRPDVDPSDHGGTRSALDHVADRAYREMLQQRPREDWMRHLCSGIADALEVVLVLLVRRHASGTLEVEACSRESALWAEMLRLPERIDGTIAGNGPAARALREGQPISLALQDEGMLPWREAAKRDGIGIIRALPLDAGSNWAMLACASGSDGAGLADAGPAAAACARALTLSDQLERDRLLACAMKQTGNAAFIANLEGEVVWCNAAFGRLSGYPPAEIIGRNPRFLSSGRHGIRHYRELWNTIRSGRVWRGETVDRDRSGTAFTALQTITPFGQDGQITHYLAMYDDISRRTREDIRRQLYVGRDPLTGLMHRAALELQLFEMLAHGQPVRIGRVAARRPSVLEALGADAIESVMSEIQARLAAVVGPECAARLGMCDYMVCLPEDESSAAQIVEDLRAELTEPFPGVGELVQAELRVATACSPRDGTDLDMLLRAADRALGAEPLDPARRRTAPSIDPDLPEVPP